MKLLQFLNIEIEIISWVHNMLKLFINLDKLDITYVVQLKLLFLIFC